MMLQTPGAAQRAVRNTTTTKACATGPMSRPARRVVALSSSRTGGSLAQRQRFGVSVSEKRRASCLPALSATTPNTVADTKKRFYEVYPRPLPALYRNIVLELQVQHHLIKFQSKHQYDKIFALGFISVYDGIMSSFPGDKEELLGAYLGALEEDRETYREDSGSLTTWASSLSNGTVDDLLANAQGSAQQQEFATYAAGFGDKTRQYNKFFAIGMFRLLELAGCTSPESLEKLTSSFGVPLERVTSDLATYKGLLSKMTKAKELMDEIIAEQRKKSAQREQERMEKSETPNVEPNGGSPPAPSAA